MLKLNLNLDRKRGILWLCEIPFLNTQLLRTTQDGAQAKLPGGALLEHPSSSSLAVLSGSSSSKDD
jgi:hypothetical protein